MGGCTSTRDGISRLLTLGIEFRTTTIELTDSGQTTFEFDSRACDGFVRHTNLTRYIGRFEFESFASQTRFLQTRTRRLELTQQIGMLSMRLLDAALHRVTFGLRNTNRGTRRL